ncbi:MAG: hypothetical protein VCE74_09635 [Alphaproteobacteria bacterium]
MNSTALAEHIDDMDLNDWVAPDCQGLNFFDIDHSLQDLLKLYLDEKLLAHMLPHYRELGEIAGGRLDELSRASDRHVPVLHTRNARGLDEDWIEFHPAYREMEQIGFGDFGIHCMSRTPRRSGLAGQGAAAGQIHLPVYFRAERIRPDVPHFGDRHLRPVD